MPLETFYLLEGLHKLVHRNGATQQRLQRLTVWDVLTHALSLLAGRGLWRLWRELVDEKMYGNEVNHTRLSSFIVFSRNRGLKESMP